MEHRNHGGVYLFRVAFGHQGLVLQVSLISFVMLPDLGIQVVFETQ